MVYTLSIGEALPQIYWEDRYCSMSVKNVDGAPLGAPLDPRGYGERTNQNWPSYTAWHDFAQRVGLLDVFYGNGRDYPYWKDGEDIHAGLLSSHPGCAAITPALLARFEAAQAAYIAMPDSAKVENIAQGQDWVLVRLNWLRWWTDWALKNCKYPSFANS